MHELMASLYLALHNDAEQAAAWLLSGGEAGGADVLAAGLALCKLQRQLLVSGRPRRSPTPG